MQKVVPLAALLFAVTFIFAKCEFNPPQEPPLERPSPHVVPPELAPTVTYQASDIEFLSQTAARKCAHLCPKIGRVALLK